LQLVGRPRSRTAVVVSPPHDSIAYELYLKGRYQADRRTEAGAQRAVAFFEAAVKRDTMFAEGWAGLVRALQMVTLRGYSIPGLRRDEVLPRLIEASQRAIDADSLRSYVWVARGLALRDIEPASRRTAIAAYERAIQLDSNNADAWHYLAVAWEDSLEPARALAAWRRAVRIDPTHRQALGFLGQHYIWTRQYDSAAKWADSGRRIDPAHVFMRQMLGRALLLRGDTAGATTQFRTEILLGRGPDEVEGWMGLADIALRRRDRAAADTLLARAVALTDTVYPSLHDAAYLGWGYAVHGDTGRALRVLERYEPRTDLHYQLHLQCDPTLDILRGTRRFRALLVRPQIGCRR